MRGRDLKLTAFALVFHAAAIAWSHVHPMTALEVAVGLGLQALTGLVAVFAFALVAWTGPRWIFLGTAVWMIGWALDAAVQLPLASQLLELSAPSATLDVGLAPSLCYAIGGAIVGVGVMAREHAPRTPALVLFATTFALCAVAAIVAEHRLADAIVDWAGSVGITRLIRDVFACAALVSLAGICVAAIKRPNDAELPAVRIVRNEVV